MDIFQAAGSANLERVQELVRSDRELVKAVDEDPPRRTALMAAASIGSLPVVQYLLSAGASVNAADREEKWTALMWAVRYGHEEVVKYLVNEAGADVTAMNIRGETSADLAVRRGQTVIASLLKSLIPPAQASEPRPPTTPVKGFNIIPPPSYQTRANLVSEMQRLQRVYSLGMDPMCSSEQLQEAIRAGEKLKGLQELLKSEMYASRDELSKQFDILVMEIQQEHDLEKRKPLIKRREDLQIRIRNEEYDTSSDLLYNARIARGDFEIPMVHWSYLEKTTNGFSPDPETYLGGGGFGDVYLGTDSRHGFLFAVKKLFYEGSTHDERVWGATMVCIASQGVQEYLKIKILKLTLSSHVTGCRPAARRDFPQKAKGDGSRFGTSKTRD